MFDGYGGGGVDRFGRGRKGNEGSGVDWLGERRGEVEVEVEVREERARIDDWIGEHMLTVGA